MLMQILYLRYQRQEQYSTSDSIKNNSSLLAALRSLLHTCSKILIKNLSFFGSMERRQSHGGPATEHASSSPRDSGRLQLRLSWHSLPTNNRSVRLEILDKERHIISFSVVGGEHTLTNYRSVTTLHSSISGTVAVESYVVDAPPGHMAEDTCTFADTIVRCNLHSLAQIDENIAK
ncbi:hypothetical protein F8388_026125 [Cannabis sativa]|uniref:Uncharacterized protein n=1 Tax=Cannabis sativa TaxID=3483 RepID=A0A7J6G028_CANSA|nr:hypothetical protein G4B88_008408 [Cannabis sativa]KAF4376325.1 hypothetical protein F8388_026125 [Cannabis sativa]